MECIERQISREPDIYFEDYRERISQYFREENFYCEPSGVVIYYQQYDIAPYSSGIRTFLIPYNCFTDPSMLCVNVVRQTIWLAALLCSGEIEMWGAIFAPHISDIRYFLGLSLELLRKPLCILRTNYSLQLDSVVNYSCNRVERDVYVRSYTTDPAAGSSPAAATVAV